MLDNHVKKAFMVIYDVALVLLGAALLIAVTGLFMTYVASVIVRHLGYVFG